MEALSPTNAPRSPHASPRHLSHLGHSTAYFGIRRKSGALPSSAFLCTQLCSPLHPPVRPRNSCVTDKSSTELRDALSLLHSWSVSMRWPERHLHQETAHILRVSSLLTLSRLRLLGHIMCMPEDRLPRQLLVCAPAHGGQSAGRQKLRWNDLVLRDLQSCNLDGEWRALTQDQSELRNRVRNGTSNLNQQKEAVEKHRKDEQKRRREARHTTSVLALHCNEVGCGFTALTQAGLVNHQRQKHSPSSTGQCKFCRQTFNRQGLHNHE